LGSLKKAITFPMPTYEYKCDACGLEFERFQQMSAAPVKKCPRCGKRKVRKLISAGAGMIFKGSGFYITDYRDQGYKDSAKADTAAPSETKSESKPDAKADSKSESKAESKTETKAETKAESTSGSEAASKSAESKPATAKAEPKASRSAKKK
jgi:putative FmdB family regulatory protein